MALSITKELESTLGLAFAEAKARRHEHVTLEHLLYALLRDPVAARILRACGARLPELRRELEQHLDESQPSLPRGADREPEHTQAFKRVLERAALQVQSSGKEQIDGGNVLVAFYRERDSHAVYLLERQGITRLDLLRYISHGALKVRDPSAMRQYENGEPGSDREHAPGSEADEDEEAPADDPLAAYCVDLVARAAAGKIDPLVGRVAELERTIHLIAEIHMLVGAGAPSGGSMGAWSLLKPALADGSLRCIGPTPSHEFKASFDRDKALARRFQKIEILEPSHEESVQILQGLKSRYEEHHGVKFSEEALRAAVELSAKHLVDRHLPDKAIDVLDEAGSLQRMLPEEKRVAIVGVHEIEQVVAKIARIPPRSVSADDKTALKSLGPELKKVVYGQDAAIEALASAILLSRSGLGTPTKPIGSFLFSGPTGVGKTELARQLARILGVPLIRFDMSEYMEKHTVSRLIGAPPGYIGFDQGGLLTDAIRKNPHAVLLLDEIERTFSPEFRNRLDGWIAFSSLPRPVILRVVDKQVDELRAQLREKNVELTLDEASRDWLAEHGFSPQFGARPMGRLLQQVMKKPLAERILFGDLQEGGKVRVSALDGKLVLDKAD